MWITLTLVAIFLAVAEEDDVPILNPAYKDLLESGRHLLQFVLPSNFGLNRKTTRSVYQPCVAGKNGVN